MSRTRTSGLLLSLAAACWAGGACGQEKEAKAEEGDKTIVVPLKAAAGKELAAQLNKQFEGQANAEFVSSLNALVVRGKPAALGEVRKTIEALDRTPRAVTVEVIVVEMLPGDKPLDEKALAGPAGELPAKLDALRKGGQIGEVKRVRVTAPEGQEASARVGEAKPFVSGVTRTVTGGISRRIQYRDLGVQVKVTPRLSPEGAVTAGLDLTAAWSHVAADGQVLGEDEKGQPIRATTFISATLKGEVTVPDGQVVVAEGVKTTAKENEGRTLVLVTARAADGGK
jgi:type II secretory pathway component GspD/PulD (secretin)